MGVPLYVICPFPLVTFNILSLSLIFVNLTTLCFDVFLLWFILPGTLCASWIWLIISFPMLGNFSAIISSNIFSGPFSLSSVSGTPKMQILECWLQSQWSLISSVQLLSHVPLFVTPRTTACQSSLFITLTWSLFKLMSIESVMPYNHLMLCRSRCFFWNSPAFLMISGSSGFSKSSLNIWKFMVHVLLKPGLENFEVYFASL